jgi:hypothetical protein
MLDTKIVSLKQLTRYRDGGSFSASFVGADGIEYCLFFGIRHSWEDNALPRYRSPVLKWSRPAEYRSPITGDISPISEDDSQPITWDEARRILTELTPLYEGFSSGYRPLFTEMIGVAADDGR